LDLILNDRKEQLIIAEKRPRIYYQGFAMANCRNLICHQWYRIFSRDIKRNGNTGNVGANRLRGCRFDSSFGLRTLAFLRRGIKYFVKKEKLSATLDGILFLSPSSSPSPSSA
jgi:hypothetical protein